MTTTPEELREPPELQITRIRNGRGLAVSGELDLSSVDLLRRMLEPELAAARHVLLDLRRVTFIDSSGLKVIVEASRALHGELEVRPSPMVRRLLEITGLEHGRGISLADGDAEDEAEDEDPLVRRMTDERYAHAYRGWLAGLNRVAGTIQRRRG